MQTPAEQAFMASLLADLDPTDLFAPPSSSAPASPVPPSPSTANPSRLPSTTLPPPPGGLQSKLAAAAQQQQAFDDLLAGVQFDDLDDDWSSLPPPTPPVRPPAPRPPSLNAFPASTPADAQVSSPLPAHQTKRPQQAPKPPLLALRPPVPLPPPDWHPRAWARCLVRSPSNAPPTGASAERDRFAPNELELEVLSVGGGVPAAEALGKRVRVELRDEWAETVAVKGDVVNLISPALLSLFAPAAVAPPAAPSPSTTSASLPTLRLSSRPADQDSLLILHPDTLVPSTTLATSLSCARRAVLRALVRQSAGDVGKPLLYGNVLHQVAQTLLERAAAPAAAAAARAAGFDEDDVGSAVGLALGEVAEDGPAADQVRGDVWRAGFAWDEVRQEVGAKAAEAFTAFGRRFVGAPGPDADNALASGPERLAVVGLHAIEEDLRSPLWGMQGKVDVSLQVALSSPPVGGGKGEGEGGAREWAVPFEIKTGRIVGQMEHRAQTSVYCLLMEERYGTPVPAGLLYYTQPNAVHKVATDPRDVRALVCRRNALAAWLRKKGHIAPTADAAAAAVDELDEDEIALGLVEPLPALVLAEDVEEAPPPVRRLPETIDRAYDCGRCYQVDVCMLYRKAVEEVVDDASPIADLYARKTADLAPAHARFFQRWEALVSLEEASASRFGQQIWTMRADERQKQGRCFADMVIASAAAERGPKKARIHRHTYAFQRFVDPVQQRPATPSASLAEAQSLLSGHIAPGDPIAVSLDPGGLVSLARGFVLDLGPERVTVGLDCALDEPVLRERLASRLGSGVDGTAVACGPLRFRIDKDELTTGMGRIRDNLAQLFLSSSAAAAAPTSLRALIVDLAAPAFDDALAPAPAELPAHLNADQRAAVSRVLTARDYALILGMPGTGKTTTVVEVVRALVGRGNSVLLTSYTHSAVDTIVGKLAQVDPAVEILRLGNPDKVNPAVAKFTLGAMGPAADMDEYERRLMRPQVIATTALTIDHPLFSRRQFDYCIVDEASQITLPVCLGPLRFARTFVLVGDHFQLPPLVKNPAARKGGLETSLFRLLHEAHPQASVALAHQYRMNADIMSLSNALVYAGGLRCGDDGVAERTLDVPRLSEVEALLADQAGAEAWDGHGQEDWLRRILDPSCKAVFLNTDVADLRESRVGDLVQNVGEAHVVQLISQALLRGGVLPSQLAAITLYRQQIKLLQHTFEARGADGVEIITADKSQGRDKDCVIVSMVRSNEHGSVGELLRDWRRINVAFTRAKAKLVVVGSRSTLGADPLLARFLALMDASAWAVDLPSHVGSQHPRLAVLREIKQEAADLAASATRPSTGAVTPTASGRRKRTAVKQEDDDAGGLLARPDENVDTTPTKAREPKKARLSEEALVKGRPLLKDVLNEFL